MNILMLAVDISMLTYVIGVAILALPVPYKGVKKWGPRLIADAIAAVVLASSASLIIFLGNKLLHVIGADWPSFYAWLSGRTAALAGVFAGLSYAATFVKTTDYSYLSSPLKMAASFIATSFSALRAIFMISSFIYLYRSKLTAIGILLYSLPFRIGKGVGAFLIAASLILYVGMPLMPAFVSSFENATIATGFKWNTETVEISVVDRLNDTVPYPVVKFFANPSCAGRAAGVIVGGPQGTLVIGDGLDALPSNFKLYVRVAFMGYNIVPSPDYVSSGKQHVVLRLKSLAYSSGAALLIPWGPETLYYNVSSGRLSIVLYSTSSYSVHVLALSNVNVTLVEVNGEAVNATFEEFAWGGMRIKDAVIPLSGGSDNITVIYTPAPYPHPQVKEHRITYFNSVFDVITSILTLCVSFLYSLVFLPGVYLAILLAMSAALARVLGGGIRIRFL